MSRRPASTWSPAMPPRSGGGRGRRPAPKKKPKAARVQRRGGVMAAVRRWPWRLLRIGALVVVLVALVAGAVVGLTRLGSSDSADSGSVAVTAAPTAPLSGAAAVRACEPLSGKVTQGNGPGDRRSAAGLIIAYEHAFFKLRDAAAMVSMTLPGSQVASEATLKEGLKTIPEGVPWCVTVTSTDRPNVYAATIRFVDAGDEVVKWQQEMTVIQRSSGAPDSWTITSVVDTSR